MCPFYGAKLLTQSLAHLGILKAPPNTTSFSTKGKIHSKENLYPYKQELFDDSKHLNIEWMDLFVILRFYKCVQWGEQLAGCFRARVNDCWCLMLMFYYATFVLGQVNTFLMKMQFQFEIGVIYGVGSQAYFPAHLLFTAALSLTDHIHIPELLSYV